MPTRMTGNGDYPRSRNGDRPTGARYASITGLGAYVPGQVLANETLARRLGTTEDWILRRTGIRERRIAAPEEFTSDLCVAAVDDLVATGATVSDVDFVVAVTTTPDYGCPSVASQVQDRVGIAGAGAIDLNAACAGFTYGLLVAQGLVVAGLSRKVLLVVGETMSKITDYDDPGTSILFGDGAGAALVEPVGKPGILAHHVGSDGAGGQHLHYSALSGRLNDGIRDGLLRQNGREVYRWAVETVTSSVAEVLAISELTPGEVTWFAPHSANRRIVDAICDRVGIACDRLLASSDQYGNTSSASIPLGLRDALRAERLRPGDVVVMSGFGAGLVHATVATVWTLAPAAPSLAAPARAIAGVA
jgi:3-oxoacyl-[acyl-carrier-protein] synthase III